jgi:hypothetical protein
MTTKHLEQVLALVGRAHVKPRQGMGATSASKPRRFNSGITVASPGKLTGFDDRAVLLF